MKIYWYENQLLEVNKNWVDGFGGFIDKYRL
jgi:hypothetical protein